MIFKSKEWYYLVSLYNYFQLNLFLVLSRKFDRRSNFHSRLAKTKPYTRRIGPKRVENEVPKSREWYYIVSMHKYYQLSLFLVLIGKCDQKPNFWP